VKVRSEQATDNPRTEPINSADIDPGKVLIWTKVLKTQRITDIPRIDTNPSCVWLSQPQAILSGQS
jgi:hypothetical protein